MQRLGEYGNRLRVLTDEYVGRLNWRFVINGCRGLHHSGSCSDGRLKIDVVKEVLVDIVNDLPESREFGFRIFGQRLTRVSVWQKKGEVRRVFD